MGWSTLSPPDLQYSYRRSLGESTKCYLQTSYGLSYQYLSQAWCAVWRFCSQELPFEFQVLPCSFPRKTGNWESAIWFNKSRTCANCCCLSMSKVVCNRASWNIWCRFPFLWWQPPRATQGWGDTPSTANFSQSNWRISRICQWPNTFQLDTKFQHKQSMSK
jgi:hypothetical protein